MSQRPANRGGNGPPPTGRGFLAGPPSGPNRGGPPNRGGQNALNQSIGISRLNISAAQKRQNLQDSIASGRSGVPRVIGSQADFHKGQFYKTDKSRVHTTAEDYKLGDIIRAAHVTPNLNSESTDHDYDLAMTSSIGPISGKKRYWVVVGIHHLYGLYSMPLFSCKGRGINAVPIAKRAECMQVVGQNGKEQSYEGVPPGHVIRTTNDSKFPPTKGSHLYLTKAITLDYAIPIERMDVCVDDSSLALLQRKIQTYVQMSFMPLKAQESFLKAQNKKRRSTHQVE